MRKKLLFYLCVVFATISFGLKAATEDYTGKLCPYIEKDTIIYVRVVFSDIANPGGSMDQAIIFCQGPFENDYNNFSVGIRATSIGNGDAIGELQGRNATSYENTNAVAVEVNKYVDLWFDISMTSETFDCFAQPEDSSGYTQFCDDYGFRKTSVDSLLYLISVNNAAPNAALIKSVYGVKEVGQKMAEGNYALSLPGGDGNVSNVLFDSLNLTTIPYTVEMMIKLEEQQNAYTGLFYNRGTSDGGLQFAAGWQDPTKLRFSGYYDGSSESVSVGEWHHVAIVQTATTRSIFLDGKESQQTGTYSAFDYTDGNTYLGWDAAVIDRAFKGLMDEVRVWTVAKDSTELADNKMAILKGNEAGLLAYYNFNNLHSMQAMDLSGNTFSGTICGGTFAPSFIRPFPDEDQTYYAIQTISKLALGETVTDHGADILQPEYDDDLQRLRIVETEEDSVYYIMNNNKTGFLYQDGGWNMKFATDTSGLSNVCLWKFVKGEGDTVYIQNANTGKFVASDNVTPGSSLYHDKNIDNPRGSWFFLLPDEVEFDFPILEKTYYAIQTISGLALGTDTADNGAKVMVPRANDPAEGLQIIESETDSVYYILANNNSSFLARSDANTWSMLFVTDTSGITDRCTWKFVKGEGDTIYIQNANSGKYVASDNVTPGSSVYHDKAIDNPRGSWLFLSPHEVYYFSTDATLSDLLVDDASVDGFNSSTLTYDVELPVGTTDPPTVTATATDDNATVDITDAAALPGSATVVVTAEDGTTTKTYTINFTVASTSDDASLSDLQVNGITVDGFNANTLTYNIELPAGTIDPPTVTATSTHANATVAITDATELPDTAIVVVTAEDGATTKTYSIRFSVAVSIQDIPLSDVEIYPNPVRNTVYISNLYNANISIFTCEGKLIKQFENHDAVAEIDVSGLEKGLYLMKINNQNNSISRMFIKE